MLQGKGKSLASSLKKNVMKRSDYEWKEQGKSIRKSAYTHSGEEFCISIIQVINNKDRAVLIIIT